VRGVVVGVVVIGSWVVVVGVVEVSGLSSVVRTSVVVVVVVEAIVVVVIEAVVVVVVVIVYISSSYVIVVVVVVPIVIVVVVEERPGLAVFDLVRELQTGLGLRVGRRAGAQTDHADCFGGLPQVWLQQAG
jgi:hypothetical protein